MGEMFYEANAVVHYSLCDNDDALAAYAHHNRGSVLSQDKDFFRYKDYKYVIYKDFEF